MKRKSLFVKVLFFVLLLSGLSLLTINNHAYAAYDGGRLIDNSVFLDAGSMSKDDIQRFLANKGSGLATRNFLMDCPATTMSEQYYRNLGAPCGQYIPASQIIYYASQIYGINPKVVLATLQKEQGLITNPYPADWDINQAMGYGCPTTGVCNSASGFLYQIDNGTWLLRYHMERARGNLTYWWTSNSWNPCGSEKDFYKPNLYPNQDVRFYDEYGVHYRTHYLSNAATSSMYCYTPHAYNNPNGLYGLPKFGSTGKYYTGSYNFVTYFERWFGDTTQFNGNIELTGDYSNSIGVRGYTGEAVTAQYTVRNTAPFAISVGGLGICARNNGINYDFGFENNVSIPANGMITIRKSRVIDRPGILSIFICSYNERLGGWAGDYYPYGKVPRGSVSEIVHNPVLDTKLSLSPSQPTLGQPVTASFSLQNNSNSPVTIPAIGIAVRDSKNTNVGYPSDIDVTIAPNSTYTYSKTKTFDGPPGSYRFWITSFKDNTWNDNYPYALNGISRSLSIQVFENPIVGNSLTITPSQPTLGQPVTASFSLQNNSNSPVTIPAIGIAVRDSKNTNVGYPSDIDVTIAPNSTYTYSKTKTFDGPPGSYRFWITSFKDNTWNDNYPYALNGVFKSSVITIK